MSKCIDLTGKTFNRWTVIRRGDDRINKNGWKISMWWCKCDCQNGINNPKLHLVVGGNLKNGTSKSCGCLKREDAIKRNNVLMKKYNKFDLSGDYGIGFDDKGNAFYFDKEDYALISQYCWHKNNGYMKNGNGILMHRLVMCVTNNDIEVDHIFHNTCDNRKTKLRLVTDQENARNRKLMINNSSGVTGVVWNKANKKWRATISCGGKKIDLGCYELFIDAVNSRKLAEERYFGEHAYRKEVN